MSRYRYSDILAELIELSSDICGGIRLQLNYYRATVYKADISNTIDRKIEALRVVASLSGEDGLKEPLADFDAMKENAHLHYVPGECSFAIRVTQLLKNTEEGLAELEDTISTEHYYRRHNFDFSKKIHRNKRKLASLCRRGTRQHVFFSTM